MSGSAKPTRGRVQALRRCITNLVENALRYGKRARVRVEDSSQALRIHACDDGPGSRSASSSGCSGPTYYRIEASRSRATGSTGLGLEIARTIGRAHGGNLVLRNAEGGGLEAVLTLKRGIAPTSGDAPGVAGGMGLTPPVEDRSILAARPFIGLA